MPAQLCIREPFPGYQHPLHMFRRNLLIIPYGVHLEMRLKGIKRRDIPVLRCMLLLIITPPPSPRSDTNEAERLVGRLHLWIPSNEMPQNNILPQTLDLAAHLADRRLDPTSCMTKDRTLWFPNIKTPTMYLLFLIKAVLLKLLERDKRAFHHCQSVCGHKIGCTHHIWHCML